MGALRMLRRHMRRQTSAHERQTAPTLELLEPRLLLSADLGTLSLAEPLLVDLSPELHDVSLRVAETDGDQAVQVVDEAGVVQAERALEQISEIIVEGTPSTDDTLRIDYGNGDISVPVTFNGGEGGLDTLRGPLTDSTWNITGTDSGDVEGIQFTGVENLTGAADNEDTFVFEDGGSLSGSVEGGDGGFDTLVLDGGVFDAVAFTATGPDSGFIERDGDRIDYQGLEPLGTSSITATEVTLNYDNTPQTITIRDHGTDSDGNIEVISSASEDQSPLVVPTSKLIINTGSGDDTIIVETLDNAWDTNDTALDINAGGGNDTIEIQDFTGAGTITIDGEGDTTGDTIEVAVNEDMILSSGSLTVGSDLVNLTDVETAHLAIGGLNTLTVDGWTGDTELNTQTLDDSLPGTNPSVAIVSIKTALDNLVSRISDMQTEGSNFAGLVNQLPFLDRELDGGLADVARFTDTFQDIVNRAKTALDDLDALPGDPTISDVVSVLDGLDSSKPGFLDTLSLTVDSVYRVPSSGSSPIEVLFNFDLLATVDNAEYDIDLGEAADALGIDIDVSVLVDAALAAGFTIGLSGDATPDAFLAPGGTISLTIDDATATLSNTPINLNFLELTASGSLTLDGEISINIIEDSTVDGRISLSSFDASVFDVQTPTDPGSDGYLASTLTLGISSGVALGGLDLSDPSVTLDFGITLPLPGDPFGDATSEAIPDFTFLATIGSTTIDLLNFGNITPNEVLGMLGGVLDTLTALASSQFMQTAIPYTDVTIGDVLDFGKSFKEDVLDPLFVSGDILDPDDNDDGTITYPDDLNFTSIQGLVSQIGAALGVPLTADYDNVNNELSFTIDFYRAFGLGDGEVETTTPWSSSHDEVQRLTFDTSTVEAFRLTYRDGGGNLIVSDVIDATADDVTIETAIHSFLVALTDFTAVPGFLSTHVVVSGSKTTEASQPRAAFDVTCDKSLGNVTQLGFAGELLLDFGASLGDFASVQTDGSFGLAAVLDTGLTFGINLSPSDELIITPALFSPDTGVSVSQAEGVTDYTIQKLTIDNANGGQFKLALDNPNVSGDGSVTSDLNWNADANPSAGSIEYEINNDLSADLNGATATVTEDTGAPAGDRIFTITFGSSPGAMLRAVDGTTELVGPADNGKLSGTATFEVEVFNKPTVSITTVTDGSDEAEATIDTVVETAASVQVLTQTEGATGINEVQILKINADSGTFDLYYDGSTAPGASDLAYNISPTDLKVAIETLTGITTVDVVKDPDALTYTITFTAPGGTDVDPLVADATNLNLSVEVLSQTEGGLVVQSGIAQSGGAATITLASSASSNDDVYNGLQISLTGGTGDGEALVITDYDGASRLATVASSWTMQPDATTRYEIKSNEVQILKINADSGTFDLTYDGDTATGLAYDITELALKTAIEGLGLPSGPTVEVVKDPNALIYFITFTDPVATDVDLLDADGSGLTLKEVQTLSISANSGTFTLSYGGGTTVGLAYNIPAVGSGGLKEAIDALPGITSVDVTKDLDAPVYTITFTNPTNVHELTVDDSALELNEIQALTILSATGGTFDLSYGTDTETGLAYNISAADLKIAIQKLTGISEVAVEQSGTTYTITFTGPSETDLDDLEADGSALENNTAFIDFTGASNDVEVAANGGNTSIDQLAQDVQDAINLKLIAVGASGVTLGFFETGLIPDGGPAFTAAGVPATTLPNDMPLSITIGPAPTVSSLESTKGGQVGGPPANPISDEEQEIVITNAGSGYFTLTFEGNTTGNIPFGASDSLVKSALVSSSGGGLTSSDLDVSASFDETGDTQEVTYTIAFKGAKADTNVGDITIDGGNLKARSYNGILRKTNVDADGITTALQDAINAVLAANTPYDDYDSDANTPDTPITVVVALSGGKLQITPDGGDVGISFSPPIQVTAGGGRLSLFAPPVKIPVDPLLPSIEVDRFMQITTNYEDPAYQELGLQSSPTRFDGTTTDHIAFTLEVNDVDIVVHLDPTETATNSSISDLVADLQSAINTAFANLPPGTKNPVTDAAFVANDVLVKQTGLDENNPNGNRIIFEGKELDVTKLSIFVPEDGNPGGSVDINGAVTELGFDLGQGETKIGKATQFFLEDVRFGGNFGLFANDISATASLGILGITASAVGTLDTIITGTATGGGTHTITLDGSASATNDKYNGYYIRVKTGDAVDVFEIDDYVVGSTKKVTIDGTWSATPTSSSEYEIVVGERFFDADVDFELRNPLVLASHSESRRVTIDLLADAINDGEFLFNAADIIGNVGGIGGNEEDPATGFIDGTVAGAMGLILALRPDGFLSGLPANLGSIEIKVDDPNWLAALPTFDDPLGLGSVNQDVTAGVDFTGYVAPSNGLLTEDIVFVVSQKYGATEAERFEELVVLKAEDTSNSSRSALEGLLQTAVNDAMARLQDDFTSNSITGTVGSIVVDIDDETGGEGDTGAVSLTGTHGVFGLNAHLDVRGNVIQLDFNHPTGWEELFNSLTDLSFDDILVVLRLVVDFLQGLDGSDGGSAAASILSYKIPLIDRSLSDVIDLGGDFLDFLDELTSNPQGSLQKLEVQFRDLLDLIGIGDPLGIFSGGLSGIDLSGTGGFTFPELNLDPLGTAGQLLEDLSFNLTFGGVDHLIEIPALDTVGLTYANLITMLQGRINLALPDFGFASGDLIAQDDGGFIQLIPKTGVTFPDLKLNPFSILKFDIGEKLMTMDFNYMVDAELTRPFNLDLENLGLPAALTSLVGLSASGNLGVEAEMDFNLSLGLDLEGADKAFFLDVEKTYLVASAKAYGTDLDFEAALGPVGLFVIGGSAEMAAEFGVKLDDAGVSDTDGRLNLIAYGDGGLDTDLDDLGDFIDTTIHTAGTPTPETLEEFKNGIATGFYITGIAKANLPLFFGLKSSPIPLGSTDPADDRTVDFGGESIAVKGNELFAGIDLVAVFDDDDGGDSGFNITLPAFDFDNLQLPTLFSLLSDPAVLVNGLNKVLKEIEGIIQGEIMGVDVPLLNDLLADNAAANFIEDFRLDLLQPLADTLVKNNVNLEGLIDLIQGVIFDVFETKLGILDLGGISSPTADDIPFMFLDELGNPTNILSAQALQIEFDIGGTKNLSPDEAISRDLGIPALGLSFNILPNLMLEWNLHFGFGVDATKGFYFVSHYDKEANDPDGTAGKGEKDPELQVSVNMDLGSTHMDRAAGIEGNLAFLKLEITDGVDLDGDGLLEFGPQAPDNFDDFKASEFSRIVLSASIDITDPDDDGKLTIPELVTTSPLETFDFDFFGGVILRAEAEVNLGGLDSWPMPCPPFAPVYWSTLASNSARKAA